MNDALRSRLRVGLADSPEGPSNRVIVYEWFVRGGMRPRGGNLVELLIDGEQTWARVAGDLEAAQEAVAIAMWMVRPDTELVRPLSLASQGSRARARLRLGALLERRASLGLPVRLLIWGLVYTPILDRWMRRWFWRERPAITVLEQDHPSPIGSLHQNCVVVDGRVGYCGGMNLEQNDWDRWAESLAARRRSWTAQLVDAVRERLGHAPYPELQPPARPPEPRGEHWVQVVRTTPGGEAGILAAYVRAIRNARRYIYIENQYFRSPRIGEELRDAIGRNPSLRLAVVVRPVNGGRPSWFDASGYWTAQTLDRIREARPEFALTQLIVHDRDARGRLVHQDVDVHAKIMVVDDLWVTIGSANIHDRGFWSEGELNLVVVDPELGAELRTRLMAEHLELALDDPRLADIDAAFDLWERDTADNPRRLGRGLAPRSRVHRFVQRGLRRPPFGVGPGIF